MKKNNSLHKFLLPWALTTGKVVNRNIVKTIKKWAFGDIYASDGKDKTTCDVVTEALATDAEWFKIQRQDDSDKKVVRLTPIRSVAEAKKLGYTEYVVPEFPEGFDPDAKVGEQQFTYGQMYAAWRAEFEQMISNPKDTYPLYTDLRGNPDYDAWESVECASDDVVYMFQQLAKMTQEIDGMFVDFYGNDPWWDQADECGFGVHIYDGIIKPEQIVKKYLPKKKKIFQTDKTLVLTAAEADWLKNFFHDHIDDIADLDGGTDYEALMTVDDKIKKL